MNVNINYYGKYDIGKIILSESQILVIEVYPMVSFKNDFRHEWECDTPYNKST